MSTIIALDNGLTPVKNYLTEKGCQIISIDQVKNRSVDAVILSGSGENLMGIQNVVTDAPVFSAQGMTPEEVWKDIQQIVKFKQ